jgi:hypothetical protein
MSPALAFGWRSSFISLRKIPKSRRIKIDAFGRIETHHLLIFRRTNHLRADRGWVVHRSEIKEETAKPAGDIRGGG